MHLQRGEGALAVGFGVLVELRGHLRDGELHALLGRAEPRVDPEQGPAGGVAGARGDQTRQRTQVADGGRQGGNSGQSVGPADHLEAGHARRGGSASRRPTTPTILTVTPRALARLQPRTTAEQAEAGHSNEPSWRSGTTQRQHPVSGAAKVRRPRSSESSSGRRCAVRCECSARLPAPGP